MRSTLGCVLAVYEGVIFFAVGIGMGKGKFDVFVFDVNDWVKGGFFGDFVIEKIEQTAT